MQKETQIHIKLHNIMIYTMLLNKSVGIILLKNKASNNKRPPVAAHGFTAARARTRPALRSRGQKGGMQGTCPTIIYIYIYI